jgi:hypothetical protein
MDMDQILNDWANAKVRELLDAALRHAMGEYVRRHAELALLRRHP